MRKNRDRQLIDTKSESNVVISKPEQRHREKEAGPGSVSDRRGGPPTQRVSGHPWRVRVQESQT